MQTAANLQLGSRIGFGCASFWCKSSFSQSHAIALVHQAMEGGITAFDTGASYGRGLAEERLGRALKQKPGYAVHVLSKAGTRYLENGTRVKDFSPAWLQQSVEESLMRLGVERLDVLQLHEPRIRDLTPDTITALHRMKDAGKIGAVGVSAFDIPTQQYAISLRAFDTLMVDYNLLRRNRAPVISAAHHAGMQVFGAMPLVNGLASSALFQPSLRNAWYLLRALKNYRMDVFQLRRFAFLREVEGWSSAQLAMAYVLAHPGITCAFFNTTRPAHMAEILAMADRPLPKELLARIEAV